jgi:hypothetical protein
VSSDRSTMIDNTNLGDPMNLYITRVDTSAADGPNSPLEIFSVSIDGQTVITEDGRTQWFTRFADADAIAADAAEVAEISWVPQYDSSWGEALDEPCGFVGRIVS